MNRAIASTITVASNEWKYVADMRTDFDATLPPVTVMPGAFNQVILKGTIAIETAPGQGTIFVIRIPIAADEGTTAAAA